MNKINIVVLGHVDHGKSTFIGRLLYDHGLLKDEKIEEIKKASKEQGKEMEFAFFMDNFEEERKNEMTIDIIYTPFKSKNRDYMLIDCPGHKELIKNMMTGASKASSAILIVSAKEGIEEQTKRHAFLARNLGIKQIFVVINKMDLVNYDKEVYVKVKEEIVEILKELGYESVYCVPISAKKGENISQSAKEIDWAGESLMEVLDREIIDPESLDKNENLVLVQDIYNVDNENLLIGKVESGVLRIGDELSFNLIDKKGVLTGIKKFDGSVNEAKTGESVGMIFEGVDVGEIERGCVLSKSPIERRSEIEVRIFPLLEDVNVTEGDYKITCGTAEGRGEVEIIKNINSSNMEEVDNKEVKNEDFAEAKLKLKSEMIMDKFVKNPAIGRFLLEKENKIVAAGIVL